MVPSSPWVAAVHFNMQDPWLVQLFVPVSQECFEEKQVGIAPVRTLVARDGVWEEDDLFWWPGL